ncbi:3'-5' exonuclease [Lysinibacillus xylanilyticus]|uniref:3'-5' exonuclease n=1 Tax=Lysinibacillus xylanilyticus TaxID=582475 RepID=UPI003D9826B5
MVKVTLTSAQMDAVNVKGEHILVKGVPGSGKTTVLMMKLQNVIKADAQAKILFITYNKTLQSYIKEYLREDLEEMDISYDRMNIQVSTYHSWARGVLLKLGYDKSPEQKAIFDAFYKGLTGSHRFYNNEKYKKFLIEEFNWIKNKGIQSFKEYKDVKRTGRGTALQAVDRQKVYELLEQWDACLKNENRLSWADYANVLNHHIKEAIEKFHYDYIFIDEAQDLGEVQLITLRKAARKGVVVAADLGQKIYKTDFTWKSVGINVLGGRTKSLSGAFRSTEEIMDLANSLLKHDSTLSKEDVYQEYEAEESGLLPTVLEAKSFKYENDLVAKIIKEIQQQTALDDWEPTIGVLVFEGYRLDNWRKSLYINKLESEIIQEDRGSALTPGVKILTMHGAKGLEFDYVIITGLSDKFPYAKDLLDDEIKQNIDIHRRLLYVSMTRAKENVYLTYKGKPSIYINELDKSLYQFNLL